MNFSQMHERLRIVLLRRIQRDELTITLLARQTGLTKSHLSKYLHSGGRLSIKAMDRILHAQHLGVADLVELGPHIQSRADRNIVIPVVPHTAALFEPEIRAGGVQMWLPLPQNLLHSLRPRPVPSRRSWRRFVAIRVDDYSAKSMDRLVYQGSIVVIDRHYNSLSPYRPPRPNVYAVRDGVRVVLRYIDAIGSRLVIRPSSIEFAASLIEVGTHTNPGDFIVGRVALILNEV